VTPLPAGGNHVRFLASLPSDAAATTARAWRKTFSHEVQNRALFVVEAILR
jgi:hypothetical protein